jgi:hypothetical protein
MAVQAIFEGNEVDVAPGGLAVLQLTVLNLGDTTDTFALAPAGMAGAWTSIHPPTVTLFGGTSETVDVEVRPPKLPSTADGATGLTVRVVPQSAPDDVVTAETRLVVSPSHDRRLTVLQPALRSRRSAIFEVMLENEGNTHASCRMHLVDPTGRVDGEFDPPSIGVEPGAIGITRLKLRASRWQWQRQARPLPFSVEAEQPTCPTVIAPATLVQAPVLPDHLGGRLLGLAAALAAVALAWVSVIAPAIDQRVDDALSDAIEESGLVGPGASVPPESETTVATTAPPTTLAPRTPFSTRLQSDAAAGATGTAVYEVPNGSVLAISDLLLQNPGTDEGTVTLLRNDEVLFRWSLGTVFGDVVRPFVTPIQLSGGEQLRMQVDCTLVGDAAAGVCTPGIVVSGELIG